MTTIANPARAKAQFDELGYLAPVRVMSAEDAQRCRADLERFERAHPDKVGLLDMKANVLLPWIDRVTRLDTIHAALAPLIGTDLLVENVGFRSKAPNKRTFVSWHQDTVYLKFEPVIHTCWLALTPATVENGCLMVIPASHRWGDLQHKEAKNSDSMLTRGHYIAEDFDKTKAFPVVLEPGEAVILHTAIVHASEPNHSTDRRIGMLIDFMPAWGKKLNGRESAMLVAGQDRWNHFDHETPPAAEAGAEEIARHRRAVELVIATFYAGSERTPEALTGKARNTT